MANKNKLDVQDKFAKVLVNLRDIRPFYSALYEILKHTPSTSMDTIGVSENEITYNEKFIETLKYSELLFVILHEVAHIALMHIPRRKNRDKLLWNIACDLYINQLLAEEFGILPGNLDSTKRILMPISSLYCSTLDIYGDFTEDTYEIFNKQAKANGYYTEQIPDKEYTFTFQGTKQLSSRATLVEVRSAKVEVKIKKEFEIELISSGMDGALSESTNKSIIAQAITKSELSNNTVGKGSGNIEVLVKKLLTSHVDWRTLLRKYCIKTTSTYSSYSKPDYRMYYQKAIYPGNIVDESNSIKGVKICVDVSGSIGEGELSHFHGQIYDLMRNYKIDCELVYWDTEIKVCKQLEKFMDIQKLNISGGGGTNPTCLFEYFEKWDCKVKPIVTIVFTDGYIDFSLKSKRWLKTYKDTIWVLTKNCNDSFKPPFGVKAFARFTD